MMRKLNLRAKISYLSIFMLACVFYNINAQANESGTLSIEINGIKNNNGNMRILIFDSKNKPGFPSKPDLALIKKNVKIQNNKVSITFENLPLGDYAVSVHHDENGDGKLNTNFLGIPNEPLGCSNDAKGFMGPPSFDKAKVSLKSKLMSIIINMVN